MTGLVYCKAGGTRCVFFVLDLLFDGVRGAVRAFFLEI